MSHYLVSTSLGVHRERREIPTISLYLPLFVYLLVSLRLYPNYAGLRRELPYTGVVQLCLRRKLPAPGTKRGAILYLCGEY